MQKADIVPTVQASITPTSTAMPTVNLNVTGTPEANPISITKAIDTGDRYILMGEFIPLPGSFLSDSCCDLELFDRNGKVIEGENFEDIDPGTPTVNTRFAFTWVEKFEKKGVTLPVTIKVVDLHWGNFTLPFEFDAGDNPQLGDEWHVNQPFDVSGTTAMLETIRVIHSEDLPKSGGGYEFSFTYPVGSNITLDDLFIGGYAPPIDTGWSGGGPSSEPTPLLARDGINFSVGYATMPKGKLAINFIFKVGYDGQQWTLTWQP